MLTLVFANTETQFRVFDLNFSRRFNSSLLKITLLGRVLCFQDLLFGWKSRGTLRVVMMVNKDWTSELRHAHHRRHVLLMHRHVTVLRMRVHLLVGHVRSHWSSHISHVRPSVHLKVVVLALMPHRSLFVKVDCGEFDALAL